MRLRTSDLPVPVGPNPNGTSKETSYQPASSKYVGRAGQLVSIKEEFGQSL